MMKHTDPRPTSEQRKLLSQVEPSGSSAPLRPLFLDEITALGRLRLVRFDSQGSLKLTDRGRAALQSS